ncbi:transposon TX1 putative protein, partial [Trifolium medium]|nr:transposon TX1 putative protein [Trifolium medium]
RDVSDHCLILLKYDDFDWGPKPFRFNNHWLKNSGFQKVVEETWGSTMVAGRKGFIAKEKLKRLKGSLKVWNKEVYGKVDAKIEELTNSIEILEVKCENVGLSEDELGNRKEFFDHLWLLLKSKDSLEFQKSRSRWLREGDANTAYFHACVDSRKKANSIVDLKKDGSWLVKPGEIKEEIVSHFRRHFDEVE